jgi:hypothetical protein
VFVSRRLLLIGLALLLVGLVAARFFAPPAPTPAPPGRLHVVMDTTLLTLQGDVRYQPLHAATFDPVSSPHFLRIGERVRTGADGYAWILFADGSSISLSPDTELLLQGVAADPAAGVQIVSVEQVRGNAWTRSGAPGATTPPSLIVNATEGRSARGGQFTTSVAPDGSMVVSAFEGTVEARTETGYVDLPSGFTTRLALGQAPTVPAPTPTPAFTLQFRIQGFVSPLLTDAHGRSVGYHPAAEPFVSQIPGARLSRGDRGAQVLNVPAPVQSYILTLRGRATEQVIVSVAIVRGGEAVATEVARQEASIVGGQTLSSGFEWRDGALQEVRGLATADGPPATSSIAVLARPPAPVAARPPAAGLPVGPPEQGAPTDTAILAAPAAAGEEFVEAPSTAEESPVPNEAPPTPAIALASAPDRPSVAGAAPENQPATAQPQAVTPSSSVSLQAAPTEVPLTVGVVLAPATPTPTALPPSPVPSTPVPPTPVPPTPVPSLPPPLPSPTATAPPTRVPTIVRTTRPNWLPAIAPTATPYRPPVTPLAPRQVTPTRCFYPSC